jgi:hypothetical protein
MDKHFISSYLKMLHIINEDRNFFSTFKTPKALINTKLSLDEIQEALLEQIRVAEITGEFFEVFDHIEFDMQTPEKFKIYFHVNHDDFTQEDIERLTGELNFIFED